MGVRGQNVGLFKPIRDYVDTLVHPSARRDALTASRHRAFIAPRLLGSIVALSLLRELGPVVAALLDPVYSLLCTC